MSVKQKQKYEEREKRQWLTKLVVVQQSQPIMYDDDPRKRLERVGIALALVFTKKVYAAPLQETRCWTKPAESACNGVHLNHCNTTVEAFL
jgi:hypothetical protein